MRSFLFFSVLGLAAAQGTQSATTIRSSVSSIRTASTTVTLSPSLSTGQPCAQVSASLAAQASTVPASLAFRCLTSVPFNQSDALALLDQLKLYLEWQSTLIILKNPPAQSRQVAIDIFKGLDDIKANISRGAYKDEYTFQQDISLLLIRARDDHLGWKADISGVFSFVRPLIALVSVSSNGTSVPQIYSFADIIARNRNPSAKISAINSINGQNTVTWLRQYANVSDTAHDENARYNRVLSNDAIASLSGTGDGLFVGAGSIYPGDFTRLIYANGTNQSFANVASTTMDFSGVVDGKTFFQNFCSPPSTSPSQTAQSSSSSAVPTSSSKPSPTAFGYPYPVIKHSQNLVGGYFLNDSASSDVAVLSVPTFNAVGDAYTEFQNVVGKFLQACKNARKTKLIIDLRGNGGGTVLLGYDMYKQLFPQDEPYGGNRLRATASLNQVGQAGTDIFNSFVNSTNLSNVTIEQASALLEDKYPGASNFVGTPFIASEDVDANNKAYTTWQSVYGPDVLLGDNQTRIIRYNLSDPIAMSSTPVSGYTVNPNPPSQAFDAKNIVLLHDGYCASTCTVFNEFMVNQRGIKSIAIGGMPFLTPMQGVGGVKGSNVYTFDLINLLATTAWNNTSNRTDTALYQLANATKPSDRVAPGDGSGANSNYQVNFRNAYRKGDNSGIPLHFIYEPADCRLFYTAPMIGNVTNTWNTVSRVWFAGNGTGCLETTDTYVPPGVGGGNSTRINATATAISTMIGTPSAPTATSTGTTTGAPPQVTKSAAGRVGVSVISAAMLAGIAAMVII